MAKPRSPRRTIAGQPFSSRLNPRDQLAIQRVRDLRAAAESLRESVDEATVLFESGRERLMEIVKRAPSVLGESAAQLEDLAGLAPKRFDYWIRYGSRPSRASAIATLSAIIETANERLIDAERAHIGRWVDTPYTLDSARDLQQALTEIIEFVRTSNSLSQVPELEEENRRHLISLCRTVIGLLEGPKVELGLLEQCAQALKKIAPVIVSAAVSAAVGAAVTNLMRPVEHACSAIDDAA